MPYILVVDDQTERRAALRRTLVRQGYRVSEARSVQEAEYSCGTDRLDLIIARLRLPDGPGTKLIQQCRRVPVLIVSGYPSIQSAVEAMRLGAIDYVPRPLNPEELVPRVAQALHGCLPLAGEAVAASKDLAHAGIELIFKGIRSLVDQVASSDTTVLILGEYGTGKTLLARFIHEGSPRRHASMLTVNCLAMPEGAFEAGLFGLHRGSLAARRLEQGTLFFDGVDELHAREQAHLLRFLQAKTRPRARKTASGVFGTRVLAAAHQDLPVQVTRRRFSTDLYLRLRVAEIRIPPLRERGEDIIRLAEYFLAQACARLRRKAMRLTNEAIDALKTYTWPGNLRELQNAIEQAAILSDSPEITRERLGLGEFASVAQAHSSRRRSGVQATWLAGPKRA